MAVGARNRLMSAGQRETGVVVIEGGRAPRSRRVTYSAVMWELIRQVIGIGRTVIVVLVAGEAIAWRTRILTVDMAVGARHGQMSARQWEAGVVVIEGGRAPGVCRMTHEAVVRELHR